MRWSWLRWGGPGFLVLAGAILWRVGAPVSSPPTPPRGEDAPLPERTAIERFPHLDPPGAPAAPAPAAARSFPAAGGTLPAIPLLPPPGPMQPLASPAEAPLPLALRRAPSAAHADPAPPGLPGAAGPPGPLADYEILEERGFLDEPQRRYYRFRLLRNPEGGTVRTVTAFLRTDGDPPESTWEKSSQSVMKAAEVLVTVDDASEESALRAWAADRGARVRDRNPRNPLREVLLPEPTLNAVPDAVAALRTIVPLAEPDYLYFPLARQPDDPDYSEQFAFAQIGAEEAWEHSTGSADAIIAVIDSGMDLDHPDLAPNLWSIPGEIPDNGIDDDGNGFIDDVHGYDFASDDQDPDDETGHGTHVSGIIGAVGDNALGVAGVNWQVRLLPLRTGDDTLSTSAIVDALDYVTALREDHNHPIIATNNSYGGPDPSELVRQAIERQRDAGILFVAAAGNESSNNDAYPSYPANHPVDNVLSVAATDAGGDSLAYYSNFGPATVDLAAPGSTILSTGRGGTYNYRSGTSMATPFVAGGLALLHALDSSLTAPQLRDTLLAEADSRAGLSSWVAGGRFLDLGAAALALDPQPYLDLPPALGDPLWLAGPAGLRVPLTLRQPDGTLVAEPYGATSWTIEPAAGSELVNSERLLGEFLLEEEGLYTVAAHWEGGGPARSTVEFAVEVRSPEANDDALFAAWDFEGLPGTTTVLDSSGEGHHGTLVGARRENGPRGQALRLDGTTLPTEERVTVTEPESGTVTFAAWVRSDSRGASIFPRIFDGPEYLFYFGRGPEPQDAFAEGNHDTLKFLAARTGADGVWYSGASTVSDGTWTHIAVTFDGTAADPRPTFYLDGERTATVAQALPEGGRAPGGSEATLGNGQVNGLWDRPWDGLLDEVRIYERVLSPREIAALAGHPGASAPDGPGLPGPADPVRPAVAASTPLSVRMTPAGWEGTWSVLAGPATASFADPTAPATHATFPVEGTYELEWETPLEGLSLFRSFPVTARAHSYADWQASFLPGDSVSLAEESPSADPDGDGFSNLWEYATGHNPLRAEDRPVSRQVLSIAADPDAAPPDRLELRFRKPAGRSDLAYRLEWAEHPAGPWENLPGSVSAPLVTELPASREEVRYTVAPDEFSSASAVFFRLVMTTATSTSSLD